MTFTNDYLITNPISNNMKKAMIYSEQINNLNIIRDKSQIKINIFDDPKSITVDLRL